MIPEQIKKFNDLAERWERGTMHLSSTRQMKNHPTYKEILSMGKEILPFIFERWADPNILGGSWEILIPELIGHMPIKFEEKEQGHMDIIKDKWFEWAKENGYYDGDLQTRISNNLFGTKF